MLTSGLMYKPWMCEQGKMQPSGKARLATRGTNSFRQVFGWRRIANLHDSRKYREASRASRDNSIER